MNGICAKCDKPDPIAHHGLKLCTACAMGPLTQTPFQAQDAFYRAVAALLRDVVEEHAVPPTLQSRIQDDMAKYACPPSVDVFSTEQREAFEKAIAERAVEIAKARQEVQAGHDMVKRASGSSCVCGTELLSAESKARGTCFDCNEAKR